MNLQIASCSTQPLDSTPTSEFRLIPAGLFSAPDGRPQGLPGWQLSRADALEIVKQAALKQTDFVIDYEHQTLNSAKNGQPNPAAGWFKRLEWRDGQGLFVTDARWTARATAMLKAKEYRFISPTFHHDNNGRVISIINAALTNLPALDGLTDLAAASRVLAPNAACQDIASAAKDYQAAALRAGSYVSTVDAVNHVTGGNIRPAGTNSTRAALGLLIDDASSLADCALSYQQSMERIGIHVTTAQAVAHVSKNRTSSKG